MNHYEPLEHITALMHLFNKPVFVAIVEQVTVHMVACTHITLL